MKTTAVYVRCSSFSQSTASQKHEIEQYLANQVICGAVQWYEDSAVSGKDLHRPALQRLQADIVGGQVETVIVWKLDRLARSIADGIKLLTDWVNRGIRVISITQNLDLSGAIGRIVAALLLGISEMEREHLLERQAAGIARAKKNGVRFGGPQSLDATTICRLKAEGHSVSAIARRMSISRQSVYNVLRRVA